MSILVYFISIVLAFLLGGAAAWIPLTIMHANSGNKNALWIPDPGNEKRFTTVHNLGQGIGALSTALVGLFSVIWVFSWFDMQPHMVFLILLGIWKVFSVLGAEPHLMPKAQSMGAALGVGIFFFYYSWSQ